MKVLLLNHDDVRHVLDWGAYAMDDQAAGRYSESIRKVIEWIRSVDGTLPEGHEVVASMIPSHSDSAGRDPAVHFTVVKAEPRVVVPLFSVQWSEFWGRRGEEHWKTELPRLIRATIDRIANSKSSDRFLLQALRKQMGTAVG